MDHTGVGWVMEEGVGHTGVGWVMKRWGGSYRGGVRWVIQRWDGVGHEKYENIKILVLATGYLIQQIKIRSAGY